MAGEIGISRIYKLPTEIGGFPAGTILLSGTSTPRNLSEAYIDLYASTDDGADWEFLSHIIYGPGPETVENGDRAIWEPFLHISDGELVCHYSTQADPEHAQKLVHKTTKDLRQWSSEVEHVAFDEYDYRPGMTVVAGSQYSGKYVIVFEICEYEGFDSDGCPVFHKVADSPLEFANSTAYPLYPTDADINPDGSPYVIWVETPGYSGKGVFLANGQGDGQIFVNADAADRMAWKPIDVDIRADHTRTLEIINTPQDSIFKGDRKLLVTGGGDMGCEEDCYNFVVTSVIDIPEYPA